MFILGAQNRVISGSFDGSKIKLCETGKGIAIGDLCFNKDTVKQYEEITSSKNKSAVGTIAKGALGAAFLGPIGLLAAASGQGTHIVAVELKSKHKLLIEINDFFYKEFIAAMF